MLDCEERLNEEEGVRPKGCGEDGEGVNGNGREEGRNGGMRTSELGRGEGPNSRGVTWWYRFRSQAIRVGGRREGGGGLVGVSFQLGAVRKMPNDRRRRLKGLYEGRDLITAQGQLLLKR
eukprot:214353-Pleurochrysis_carterae.AAC.1